MAESPQQVIGFFEDLAHRAKPMAQRELADLEAFALRHLDMSELEPWDIAYVSEKLRQHRYALSQEDLKSYSPLRHVVVGLFYLFKQLYEFDIVRRECVVTCHPDVRFYEITNAQCQPRGRFYLVLYTREHNR